MHFIKYLMFDNNIYETVLKLFQELEGRNMKFLPGILKWQKEGHIDYNNIDDVCKVRLILKVLYISPAFDFFDEEFNGRSPEEVCDIVGFSIENQKKKSEISSKYDIIQINSFEDAKKIAGKESWCIAISEEAYNEYTKDGNRFYFLASNNWKELPCEPGIEFPYDEYGCSLIAVEISPEKELVSVTSRWNTCSNNSDYFLSPDELKKILGRKFEKLFN